MIYHRINHDDFGEPHHELGGYLCHTCDNHTAWIRGTGWRCDNCGQRGHVILIRESKKGGVSASASSLAGAA